MSLDTMSNVGRLVQLDLLEGVKIWGMLIPVDDTVYHTYANHICDMYAS